MSATYKSTMVEMAAAVEIQEGQAKLPLLVYPQQRPLHKSVVYIYFVSVLRAVMPRASKNSKTVAHAALLSS